MSFSEIVKTRSVVNYSFYNLECFHIQNERIGMRRKSTLKFVNASYTIYKHCLAVILHIF